MVLGILAVVNFCVPIVAPGLIAIVLGIVGMKKSKEAGLPNPFALVGIICGSIGTAYDIVWFFISCASCVPYLCYGCAACGAGGAGMCTEIFDLYEMY
jgi:hypothetical protein